MKSDKDINKEKSPKHECHDDLLSLQSIDSNIKNIMRSPYDIRASDKQLKSQMRDAKISESKVEEKKEESVEKPKVVEDKTEPQKSEYSSDESQESKNMFSKYKSYAPNPKSLLRWSSSK